MVKYWIDQSCHQACGGDFDVYVQEAFRLARLAATRLDSPQNTDFHRVFNVLFKTPTNATEKYPRSEHWLKNHDLPKDPFPPTTIFERVKHNLANLGSVWEKTDVQAKANICLYADQLARFKYSDYWGTWDDPVNGVALAPSWFNDGKGNPPPNTYAIHTKRRGELTQSTIDFFPPSFQGLSSPWHAAPLDARLTIPDMDDGEAWELADSTDSESADSIDSEFVDIADSESEPEDDDNWEPVNMYLDKCLPRTIIHEFLHSIWYSCEDTGKLQGGDSWRYSMNLTKAQAFRDSEPHALLCVMAGLADVKRPGKNVGGFTVSRDWDKQSGSNDLGTHHPMSGTGGEKWMPYIPETPGSPRRKQNPAYKGIIVYYKDITS